MLYLRQKTAIKERMTMKITVINGSPKGKYSITLQTVRYLERRFGEHSFSVIDAGQRIKSLERDFSEARAMLEGADAIIFSYLS